VNWLRSHLTGRPFLVERDDLPAMRALVDRLLSAQEIDAIHADQLTMAQFALPAPFSRSLASRQAISGGYDGRASRRTPLLVFDAHNATWSLVERMLGTLPGWRAAFRPILGMEARRVKRYEGMIVGTFDHTLAVTTIDERGLTEAFLEYKVTGNKAARPPDSRLPITVIPIAVDTGQRQPIHRQANSTNILTLGTLHYPPNADGIRWFAREVFPRVRQEAPTATLTIVGKNPPADFVQMAEHSPQTTRVTGYVPDLVPFLEEAALVVVPVRAGSGMRVRILEMFAHAMPVVTTAVGLEGIDAVHNKEVLVADSPEDFAAAVVRLLNDRALQTELAANGRRLAEERYDWKVALGKLADIYHS
jgi:glycosyltransferase involved in cell wall biosynthesis